MKKFLFALLAGVSAGILFAPKSGKKLREQLKNSDTRFTDFGNALVDATKDAGLEVQEFIDSDDVKNVLASGKKTVEDFATVLDEKGSELSKKAQAELDTLVENAIKTAKEAKKSVSQVKDNAIEKVKSVKKSTTKKSAVIKKTAEKKAKNAAKIVSKKIGR